MIMLQIGPRKLLEGNFTKENRCTLNQRNSLDQRIFVVSKHKKIHLALFNPLVTAHCLIFSHTTSKKCKFVLKENQGFF